MDKIIWDIRWAVFDHIKNNQTIPTIKQISKKLGINAERVEQGLNRLNDDFHALAYDKDTKNISMAWPFSATPTNYPVDTPQGRYWANCAWDALSIPSLLNTDSESIYHCPDCKDEISIKFVNGKLIATDAVVHFSIPPKVFYENLGCI